MWWACDEDFLSGRLLYMSLWSADARRLYNQMRFLLNCPLQITAHSAWYKCEVDEINRLIHGHKLALIKLNITKEIGNQSRIFP